MKIAKLCILFVIAFAMAWILIFTFTQPEFTAKAPIKLFWYSTPEFPMYIFAAFSSALTLLFGFAASAYYYVAGRAGIRSKKKEIARLVGVVKEMEAEMERQRAEIERMRASADKAGEKITKSHRAVGEKDLLI